MRENFNLELESLTEGIIKMGNLVEESSTNATKVLLNGDKNLAEQNIEDDKKIDQQMKDIETLCLRLLLSQQPVAHDLRFISASLKMVSDLERIGDQCADISEIVLTLSNKNASPVQLSTIPLMIEKIGQMISQSVDAFILKDVTMAKDVCCVDDIIDRAFTESKKELIESIRSSSANADNVIDSFMIAKYLERIGDHAVNVARWAIFEETGSRIIPKQV